MVRNPRLPNEFGPAQAGGLLNRDIWEELEVKADLTNTAIKGLEVLRCPLAVTTLTAASLPRSRITDTVFKRCEISGAVLAEARLTCSGLLVPTATTFLD